MGFAHPQGAITCSPTLLWESVRMANPVLHGKSNVSLMKQKKEGCQSPRPCCGEMCPPAGPWALAAPQQTPGSPVPQSSSDHSPQGHAKPLRPWVPCDPNHPSAPLSLGRDPDSASTANSEIHRCWHHPRHVSPGSRSGPSPVLSVLLGGCGLFPPGPVTSPCPQRPDYASWGRAVPGAKEGPPAGLSSWRGGQRRAGNL